jgi:hypothetical protein
MTSASRRTRVAVAALSLLVLGAVAGIAADRMLHRPDPAAATSFPTPQEALAALDSAAKLRPEQRERIHSILASRQADIDTAWRDAREHVNRTMNAVITEIEGVLDAEQIPPFRALVEHIHGPARDPLHH